MRTEKITWKKIYDDFKKRHPTLSKMVIDYRPYNYATILIFLTDGTRMTYNYDEKRAIFVANKKNKKI